MSKGRAPAGVRVHAFAKINPTLRVLGLRDDGYHDLRVTFQSLALHDTIEFTPTRRPFTIDCDDPSVPCDRTNLVWKAAARIWRAAGKTGAPRGVHVQLTKRIPAQAGLGGGSSDAAATLRALNALWRTSLDAETLHALAVKRGADVPYFLTGGSALGLDRGDRLVPLPDWPAVWLVILRPPFGGSTPEAYGWFDADARAESRAYSANAQPDQPPPRLRRSAGALRAKAEGRASYSLGWTLQPEDAGTDLQPPVSRRHPEIARLVRSLRKSGAVVAAMSGSGTAVFGVFRSRSRAEAAALELAAPQQPAIVTRTIGRREHSRRTRPLPNARPGV